MINPKLLDVHRARGRQGRAIDAATEQFVEATETGIGRCLMLVRFHWSVVAFAVGLALLGCQTALPKTCDNSSPGSMTLDELYEVVKTHASDLKGGTGQWEFRFDGVPMALLTSVPHDRMRIIAPIVKENTVTSAQRVKMLEANFHTALDPRYATSHGIVYGAFIHPLSPLRPDQVRSAISQVAQLVKTFGSTYSSGGLRFSDPGPSSPETRPLPPARTL